MSFALLRQHNDRGIDRSLFNFVVDAKKITDDTLEFKITFDNPKLISIDRTNLDYIIAEVIDTTFFSDAGEPVMFKNGAIWYMPIPRLLDEDEIELTEKSGMSTQSTIYTLAGFELVANLALSISLKQMWNILNVLQVTVFMVSFTVCPALL